MPVEKLSSGHSFAPIGLIDMFNSGGAIKELKYEAESGSTVSMKVRGCGMFGAYSSARPERVAVDGIDFEFEYEEQAGLITFTLRVPEQESYQWDIIVKF